MKNKAAIFDFDGTIADSEEVMMKIYQAYAEKKNRPAIDRKVVQLLRDGTTREALKWAKIRFWQIPGLLKLGRAEYKKQAKNVRIFTGIEKVIQQLSSEYDIYILSTNSEITVKKIIKLNEFKPEVTILKGSSVFGKAQALKKLLKEKSYTTRGSWMIGDELRDIEAGKKVGINTLGVTWGLQSEVGLQKAKPDKIVNKPDEISLALL